MATTTAPQTPSEHAPKETLAGVLAKANRAARQSRPKVGSLVEIEGEAERFYVISLASEKVEQGGWEEPPRGGVLDAVATSRTPASKVWDVPAGFHVRGVETGKLATHAEGELKVVGNVSDLPLQLI